MTHNKHCVRGSRAECATLCVLLSVWIVQFSDDVSVHAIVRFSIVLVPLSHSLSLDPARTITRTSRIGVPLAAAAAVGWIQARAARASARLVAGA
jgi:hypothetical protein